jgi:hypothetical protein
MGDFYFNSKKSNPKTEKADKPEPPSESVSQAQVAAITDDKKRNSEPWTGIWEVKYFYGGGYRLVLKQNGKTVKSTSGNTEGKLTMNLKLI